MLQDGNAYDVGHRVSYATTNTTINSTSVTQVTPTLNLGIGWYEFEAIHFCQQGTHAVAQEWDVEFSGTMNTGRFLWEMGDPATVTYNTAFGTPASMSFSCPDFPAGDNFFVKGKGLFQMTTTGATALGAYRATSASDTFQVLSETFFMLKPLQQAHDRGRGALLNSPESSRL
jgi:hypothetical protein